HRRDVRGDVGVLGGVLEAGSRRGALVRPAGHLRPRPRVDRPSVAARGVMSDGPNASPDPDAVHAQLRRFWDDDAATYDHSLSHGLTAPAVAAAWRGLLARHLPPGPARVLDVGAGTGAMSLLAAEL